MVSIEIIDEDANTETVPPPSKPKAAKNGTRKVNESTTTSTRTSTRTRRQNSEKESDVEPAAIKTESKAEEPKTEKPKTEKPKPKKSKPKRSKPKLSITEPSAGFQNQTTKTQVQLFYELETHKKEGNIHFKANALRAALWSYGKGEEIMKELTSSNLATKEVKELRIGLMNNISFVHFKEQKYQQTKEYATKVLLLDPANVKALYRRAVAFRADGDCHSARADLRQALKHDPDNRAVQKELLAVKQEVENDKKKSKRIVKEAFLNKSARKSFLYDDKEEEAIKNPPKPMSGVYPARYHSC
mmetsp:Transcript_9508/g.13988  ORF Transcript_9508/g.13988 Transcript_9508/m.13988 type:complete len:301 (-) Transcript_9508:173-1075(-)